MTNFTGGGFAVGLPGSEFGTYTFDPQGNVWQSNLPINTTGTLTANSVSSINDINTYGDVNAVGNIHAGDTIFAGRMEIASETLISGDVTVQGHTIIRDGLAVNGTIDATGDITAAGTLTANALNIAQGIDLTGGNLVLNNMAANTISVGVFTMTGDTIASANGTMIIDPAPPGTGGNVVLAAASTSILGNSYTTGSSTAAKYYGDGSGLTNMYGNQNVQTYLPSYSGALNPAVITAPIGNIVAINASTLAATLSVSSPLVSTGAIKQTTTSLSFLNSSGTAVASIDSNGLYSGAITNTAAITAIGYVPYDSSNPAGYITQAQVGLVGLGWGGTTWHNVTGSRGSGASYTNSYPYPIMVSASGTNGGPSPNIDVYVNGILISSFYWQFNGSGARAGGSAIVPAGATYQLNFNGCGIANWAELY